MSLYYFILRYWNNRNLFNILNYIEMVKEYRNRENNVIIKILEGEKVSWMALCASGVFSALCVTGQICFVRPILTDIC